MKNIILIVLLIGNALYSQDRLSFVKDATIKVEMQKSIDYLNTSTLISKDIKSKVVFITFDFHYIYGQEIEGYGITYSTYIPTLFSELNKNGQFEVDEKFGILFFNYSKKHCFCIFQRR
ncbi:MAG: hypothetical protein K0R77_2642 [Chryseobacterium sp.]|jgi:hypothetical protein|uniref:hypothetical protein n=1 Tax=Chryseobacterium sp. TaxID=1871047 RepID=UPI002615481F|nr:hypothetical protein [Chryseobacterium sp.]MDF2553367.1 hypothetical protein [Chryseobacterium sp.]